MWARPSEDHLFGFYRCHSAIQMGRTSDHGVVRLSDERKAKGGAMFGLTPG